MAYIYCANLWCDSCGKAIMADLEKEFTPEQLQGRQQSGDSDDWPQHCGDLGESDSPSHCGANEECLEAEVLPSGRKIGSLLSTDLTYYGADYVADAIKEGGEVAEFWRKAFSDYPQVAAQVEEKT
jgi:hypothetical protein